LNFTSAIIAKHRDEQRRQLGVSNIGTSRRAAAGIIAMIEEIHRDALERDSDHRNRLVGWFTTAHRDNAINGCGEVRAPKRTVET
jgi:hypothetical protein